MPNTHSRFLQHLQPQSKGLPRWIEVPAVDGAAPKEGRYLDTVEVQPRGRLLREIRAGMRLVLKTVVRILYFTPVLILLSFALGEFNSLHADMVTVAFVMIVVIFFVLLNMYLLWSVVCHVVSRRGVKVVPPFENRHGDLRKLNSHLRQRAAQRHRSIEDPVETIVLTGTVHLLDDSLPRGGQVVRDLWALDGSDPWRLTESVDFVVVTDDEKVVVVSAGSAPFLVHQPRRLVVEKALGPWSTELVKTFHMAPRLVEKHKRSLAGWLQLEPGDRVELAGSLTGSIPNVERFELNGRQRVFDRSKVRRHAPYRGSSGEPGTLVSVTPDKPLLLKKIS